MQPIQGSTTPTATARRTICSYIKSTNQPTRMHQTFARLWTTAVSQPPRSQHIVMIIVSMPLYCRSPIIQHVSAVVVALQVVLCHQFKDKTPKTHKTAASRLINHQTHLESKNLNSMQISIPYCLCVSFNNLPNTQLPNTTDLCPRYSNGHQLKKNCYNTQPNSQLP